MNANLLKGSIVALGMTQGQAAKLFGMSQNSLSRKMMNKREFTLGETIKIKDVLCLSDQQYYDIFLRQTSHICNDRYPVATAS